MGTAAAKKLRLLLQPPRLTVMYTVRAYSCKVMQDSALWCVCGCVKTHCLCVRPYVCVCVCGGGGWLCVYVSVSGCVAVNVCVCGGGGRKCGLCWEGVG